MNERLQLANILVGFLLPHAIAIVNQSHWPARAKSASAFVVCAVAAGFTTWIAGDFDAADLTTSVLVIFGAAHASYRAIWHPTGIPQAIEKKTTVTEPPPP